MLLTVEAKINLLQIKMEDQNPQAPAVEPVAAPVVEPETPATEAPAEPATPETPAQ